MHDPTSSSPPSQKSNASQFCRPLKNRPQQTTEFAQTAVQLFNQAIESELKTREMALLEFGLKIAQYSFCGQFRPHRKTFESHLIGTASVLMHFGARIDVVIGGLLHALYEQGDLSLLPIPEESESSDWISTHLGEGVERLVRFHKESQWRELDPKFIEERFEKLNRLETQLLLIRTANYIEELSDFSILYCKKQHESDEVWMDQLEKFASKIGFLEMADCLSQCRLKAKEFEVPDVLKSANKNSYRLPR